MEPPTARRPSAKRRRGGRRQLRRLRGLAVHLDRAAAYEARRHRDQPVEVETLSTAPLDQLRSADAAAWVDRKLVVDAPLPIAPGEKRREFTLAPWRPALERQLGRQVRGLVRGDGINWQLRRAPNGPEVS